MALNFGKWLQIQKVTAGLNQEKIGKALKVNPGTVSKWERGDSYPALHLDGWLWLSETFDTPLSEIPTAKQSGFEHWDHLD